MFNTDYLSSAFRKYIVDPYQRCMNYSLPTETKDKISSIVKGIFATIGLAALYTFYSGFFIASFVIGINLPKHITRITLLPDKVMELARQIHVLALEYPRACIALGVYATIMTPPPVTLLFGSIFAGSYLGSWVYRKACQTAEALT